MPNMRARVHVVDGRRDVELLAHSEWQFMR
jgi:hypothetical protein